MNDQIDGENENIDKTEKTGHDGNEPSCGPGCDCDTPGLSKKGKVIVCLVVSLAAAVVLARGFMKRAGTENDGDQQAFTTVLPAAQTDSTSSTNEIAKASEKEKESALWGDPLDSLISLNKVAAQKDAVFVFLPTGNDESEETAKKEIETAASKIMSRGTTMAAYILKKDTRDYAQVTSRVPAPCVLAMVKGRGMSVANKITEADLIQAIVTASRPSSCGPAAAGSSCCP